MRFLFLPDGEDPDTMVRKIGKEAFEQLLQTDAVPLSTFMFDVLLQRHSVATTEDKAALKAEAEPLLRQIPGEFQQQLLFEALSKHTGELDKYKARVDSQHANRRPNVATTSYRIPDTPVMSPGRMMLRLLLDNPAIAQQCGNISPAATQQLNVGNLEMLVEMQELCLANPGYSTAQIMEHYRHHKYAKALGKLLAWDPVVTSETAQQMYQDSFKNLIDRHLQGRMEELLSKARLGSLSQEEKQELKLLSLSKTTG